VDYSIIFKLRNKRFWWVDVIFYFSISLLIAAIFCYFVFSMKNGFLKDDIKKETASLQTVGTEEQKQQEQQVIGYKAKLADFSTLLTSHRFASNVFAFMRAQTMPNIWFKQFALNAQGNSVQLSGEADDADALSRQVAVFENNKYIKSIGTLNSSSGNSSRLSFNINLVLSQDIFNYLPNSSLVLQAAALSAQNQNQANSPTPSPKINSQNLITAFHFLLNPEVIGTIDQSNYTITLNVPYDTDVTSLMPSIIVSTGAAVFPASNVVQNFTSPVIYRVTGQDGSLQNYTVKVAVSLSPLTSNKPSQSGSTIFITASSVVAVIVVIIVLVWLFIRKRKKNQEEQI